MVVLALWGAWNGESASSFSGRLVPEEFCQVRAQSTPTSAPDLKLAAEQNLVRSNDHSKHPNSMCDLDFEPHIDYDSIRDWFYPQV
jgi:hypothetical protein